MEIAVTTLFKRNLNAKTRYVLNEGGTRSSKSYSIMQVLYYIAAQSQKPIIISICSETMPHLRKGVMRDFFVMLESNGLYNETNHNKSESTYRINKATIEFFSTDTVSKVHGPGRDYLFVNELQNIPYEIFFHLVQRTNVRVFADWNPTHEFFIHKDFLNNVAYSNDITYIHSTLLDNPFLSVEIKKDVLRRAERDDNYRRVYLDGKIGNLDWLVIPTFTTTDTIPDGATAYGLDFGYSNDPTALVQVTKVGYDLHIRQLIYRTGLLNREIIALMKDAGIRPGYDEIFADSAEPKSIEEIRQAGFNVKPADKGKDSIMGGVQFINSHRLHVTKDSTDLIKELRNYTYVTDSEGKATNKPVDAYNHAIDAVRYACYTKWRAQPRQEIFVPSLRRVNKI